MNELELKKTQVDLAGLMEVLGKNLYSTPTVAIRELVQNAHDSCVRRRLESPDGFEPLIVVEADHARGVLAIEDRGAGLTKEEIERYLATVGAGYTKKMRAQHADAGLIGMFGLGFLSAFIVGERVDVYTTSYQEPEGGWHFSSRSGESYTVRAVPPRPIGTRVELALQPGFKELSNPRAVRTLLERYCCLLPIPVHAREPGKPLGDAVNTSPPWRLEEGAVSPLRLRKLRLDLAKRFESVFEPICTFPLRPGAPGDAPAHGLVWIQDGATYGTSDNRSVSVFVRGMMVSRDERDLLPAYAGFAGAVIECDALSPTASREDLQEDDVYLNVSIRVRETLIEGLVDVARNDPPVWRRILMRHNEALLGAALCDDRLFELLSKELRVPTSEGDLPLPKVLERGQGKIHVSIGDRGGYEETLFRALMVPVVAGTRYAALPFATRFGERAGAKVVRLGTKEGNEELFVRATLTPEKRALLVELFGEEELEIVAARFRPDFLPLVLIPDREVLLKERIESDEADKRISSAVLGMARLFTNKVSAEARAQLFVNLDSELITRLLDAEPGPRRTEAARLLSALARLMSRGGDGGWETDLSRTLRECQGAILALLGGGS